MVVNQVTGFLKRIAVFRNLLALWMLLGLSGSVRAVLIPEWWKTLHHYNPATDWHEYMTYTPAFFGPNALPVPEVLDGRLPARHSAELSADVFWGFGDQTQSLSPKLTYASLSGRFAVSGWGVLAEHYKTTRTIRDLRASMEENPQGTLMVGDFYLSTQLAVLREKKYLPDLILEIVLKTSSSSSPSTARYFDTPGYYFDLTAAKSLYFKNSSFRELRFVGMYGFLCYQLNNGRQNDAPLYGGKIKLFTKKWNLETSLAGYQGWLDKGDQPLVLRGRFDLNQEDFQYFIQYQHALRDYPFRRLQLGTVFHF